MSSNSFERAVLALFLAGTVYAWAAPAHFSVQVLVWISLAAVLASAMRFVMLIGEFNMATGAFYGIGAYAAGYLNTAFGWPVWLSFPAAALVAAVIAAALGFSAMRASGPYFMLISFAFAEIVRLVYIEVPALGGNNGILGIMVPRWLEPLYPALVMALCIALVLGLAAIERSPLGLVFKAIRNKEAVVRSVGVNVLAMRVLCLTIASVAVSIAGAAYAHVNAVISPGDFTFLVSVFALAYVKLGGDDAPVGPVVGAAVLTVVAQFALGFGAYDQLVYGVIIVLAMVALPDGLLGRLRQWRMVSAPASTGTGRG